MTLRGVLLAALAVLGLSLGGCTTAACGTTCAEACAPHPVQMYGWVNDTPLCICAPSADGGR